MALCPGGVGSAWVIEPAFPRLIIGHSGGSDAFPVRFGRLTVDIFAEGNSVALCETIRERITDILTAEVHDTGRYSALRYYYSSDTRVADPDPALIHWMVEYDTRYGRAPEED